MQVSKVRTACTSTNVTRELGVATRECSHNCHVDVAGYTLKV